MLTKIPGGSLFPEGHITRHLDVRLPAGMTAIQAFENAPHVFEQVQGQVGGLLPGDFLTMIAADHYMQVVVDTITPLRFVTSGGGKPRIIEFNRQEIFWQDEHAGVRVQVVPGGWAYARKNRDGWTTTADVFTTPEGAKQAALKTLTRRTGMPVTTA